MAWRCVDLGWKSPARTAWNFYGKQRPRNQKRSSFLLCPCDLSPPRSNCDMANRGEGLFDSGRNSNLRGQYPVAAC